MKSDSYLNHCIEQARLSPLHYRHGSIVVKGGKVIGQGFNDYRPGYDGGNILKSGVLPKSAYPSAEPKKDNNSKSKFKPVEAVSGNCGGSHHANASLSMHSEMMAINSALASSSTLAASTAQHIKPCFKVFGDSKRKRELRREALAAYVRAVCLAAARGTHAQQQQQCTGSTQTNEWRFEPYTNYVQSGKVQAALGTNSSNGEFGQRKARNEHLLVPKVRTESSTSGIKDRMKHPKLVGADVYVMRLGRPCSESLVRKNPNGAGKQNDEALSKEVYESCSASSGSSSSTGSLHDELSCKVKKAARRADSPIDQPGEVDATKLVAESRPCYRCISYMHSVGVKRVFWTTSEGKWEGAKVRDLVDHLEGAMVSSDNPIDLPVFVTKHEVLLLRRLMLSGEM
ncbi:hypothetical protein N0V82_008213 [Gnomoniopsis sp. IMI 355080]|nr:hypothetical protein N0V82_008213 [Gnomoniopsis sp. IMI 355080]